MSTPSTEGSENKDKHGQPNSEIPQNGDQSNSQNQLRQQKALEDSLKVSHSGPPQKTLDELPQHPSQQIHQNVPPQFMQNGSQRHVLPHMLQSLPSQMSQNMSPQYHPNGSQQALHNGSVRGPQPGLLHGMPQIPSQGGQPVVHQPATISSLPPSHPVSHPLAQPSPADQGDQRPCEPTSRRLSGGSTASQDSTNANIRTDSANSLYKQQPFSPESQTQLGRQGPVPLNNQAPPMHSQGPETNTMAQYGANEPTHSPYGPQMGRPLHPSNQQGYPNQASPSQTPHYATYHQQGVPYQYRMATQHPQEHPNIYPQFQQQQFYQHNRPRFSPEEWPRPPYQPQHPMMPNSYPSPSVGTVNGRHKDNTMSPQGSDGSGASLMSPSPLPDGSQSTLESREHASPAKQARTEERSDSPKELLDLDSHNAASRHPTSAQPHPNFPYGPRAMHPSMQQGSAPHMMAGGPFSNYQFTRGHFAPQHPLPHLMEALQRPQHLPFSPGQTRMAMYRHPHVAGHFQGMVVPQRTVVAEHLIRSG